MPGFPVSAEKVSQIRELLKVGGVSRDRIAEIVGVGHSKVDRVKHQMRQESASNSILEAPIESDKKVGEFDWEEWCEWIENGQELRKKASWCQHDAEITLGDGTKPVILFQLGDTHIGSWATDYKLLREITAEINETPELYIALVGDLVEMAIKMRSVLEVMGQILTPEQQLAFLESWLEKIMPKVAFSCWCNHGVEREEKMSGISSIKNLLSRKSVYFNGIGHPDIKVGDQTYKFTVSHKFRGSSMYDSNFGAKRYLRMEANGREISIQGDLHRPAISVYVEGGDERVAMTSGTLVLNSGYAQRYFSLKTFPVFPCIVLRHDRHEKIPFWNLQAALDYVKGATSE